MSAVASSAVVDEFDFCLSEFAPSPASSANEHAVSESGKKRRTRSHVTGQHEHTGAEPAKRSRDRGALSDLTNTSRSLASLARTAKAAQPMAAHTKSTAAGKVRSSVLTRSAARTAGQHRTSAPTPTHIRVAQAAERLSEESAGEQDADADMKDDSDALRCDETLAAEDLEHRMRELKASQGPPSSHHGGDFYWTNAVDKEMEQEFATQRREAVPVAAPAPVLASARAVKPVSVASVGPGKGVLQQQRAVAEAAALAAARPAANHVVANYVAIDSDGEASECNSDDYAWIVKNYHDEQALRAAQHQKQSQAQSQAQAQAPVHAQATTYLPAGLTTKPADDYSDTIFANLLASEVKYLPNPSYMDTVQGDLSHSMRSILIDWLVEVAEEYQLGSQTVFLSVAYIDRFLSVLPVDRSRLQLVGVTAMLVAAKYWEIRPPLVDDFVYISDNTYTREQVITMESVLLKTLRFSLTCVTPWEFARRFVALACFSKATEHMCDLYVELFLVDPHYLHYRASVVAAAAVYIARHTLQCEPVWPAKLSQAIMPYDAADPPPPARPCGLRACVRDMRVTILRLLDPGNGPDISVSHGGCSLKAIREKYNTPKFSYASQIKLRRENWDV